MSAIHLAGIDHVIVCAAIDGKVHLAPHLINLRRSGTRVSSSPFSPATRPARSHAINPFEQVPRVQLEPIGPAMVLRVRRHQFPAPDLWALACKQPKQCVVLIPCRDAIILIVYRRHRIMPTKVKNVSVNEFGDRIGAVHIQKQDLDSMQLRKRKAFVARREPEDDNDDATDSTGKRRRRSTATHPQG